MSENTKEKKERKKREKAIRKQVMKDEESVKLIEDLIKAKKDYRELSTAASLAYRVKIQLCLKLMKKHDLGWFDVEILEQHVKERSENIE